MKIKDVTTITNVASVNKVKKSKPVERKNNRDKIEISREAKELSRAHSNLTPERIAEINRRMQEKFYDRDDVLDVVASRILKSSFLKDLLGGQSSADEVV